MNVCHYRERKEKGQSTSQMTNDKDYHMILVIIIVVRGETMLQRALGSGWGVMIPGALIVALGYAGVSADVWRVLVAVGMLDVRGDDLASSIAPFYPAAIVCRVDRGIMLMIVDIKLRG
ncbi:tryptophan-specific transport protein [Klebsiella pneumoniae]|uniref:Tryptophan-specific transport protein n=1 Tax=Klebsiella pneumoniae TaxID=573 RepID=A0A377TK26_KLEPN|nr:tryptophan-specific transport protein [Klebsiella pneumoniae]